ncbi:hypothetical protein N7524_001100 [Penicillium chrysogenum]|nr:hypothetical protein N7524_001100 [Penicillium chrysogenum]
MILNKIEGLPESPKSNLSRLTRYFATRLDPTLLNTLASFLTTIISLYTTYNSDWSIIVLLTMITSSLSITYSLILLYIYKFSKLERLK